MRSETAPVFDWSPYKTKPQVRRETRRAHRELSRSPLNDFVPVPLNDYSDAKQLRTHAKRFGCFPEPLENFTVIAILDTLSITLMKTEVLLESERHFVLYHWYSTA